MTNEIVGYAEVIGATGGGGANPVPTGAYFGDGSDGDFTVKAGTTHSEPVAIDAGTIIKQYKNLTIEAGAVWKPANRCNLTKILVLGDLTLDGSITVDKLAPFLNDSEAEVLKDMHWNACNAHTQLKGGKGGNGGSAYYAPSSAEKNVGASGIGGAGFELGGGLGAGSGGVVLKTASDYNVPKAYPGGNGDPRPPIGTTIPYPATKNNTAPLYGVGGGASNYLGGAGPGGSGALYFLSQSSGGGPSKVGTDGGDALGGGCVLIFVKGKVRIGATGSVTADGGIGAKGAFYSTNNKAASGGGGGGGGGIIALIHMGDYINTGSVHANGGAGGEIAYTGWGSAGGDGEVGTVLIAPLSEILA